MKNRMLVESIFLYKLRIKAHSNLPVSYCVHALCINFPITREFDAFTRVTSGLHLFYYLFYRSGTTVRVTRGKVDNNHPASILCPVHYLLSVLPSCIFRYTRDTGLFYDSSLNPLDIRHHSPLPHRFSSSGMFPRFLAA
jgi:hypothetical protein